MTEVDKDLQRGIGEWDYDELVFSHGGKITRKRLLLAGGAAAGAAAAGPLLFTTAYAEHPDKKALPYKAHTNVKGNISFWHFWSSPLRHGSIRAAIKQFNKYYPHIKVTDLPIPFGDIFTKLHAAVAAGQGMPDVMVADRTIFWIDARSKTYDPLTPYAARDKFNGSKIYFPFTWHESNVVVGKKNELFGLPFETDIRLFYWNHGRYVDAGLHVNKPPTKWNQISSYAAKLDSQNVATYYPLVGDGGDLNGLVWTSHSDWQTSKMKPTVSAARNVSTADFVKKWVDHYGGQSGFRANITANSAAGKDEFESGNLVHNYNTPTYHDFMVSLGVQLRPTKGPKAGQPIFPYWGTTTVPINNVKGAQPRTFAGGFALAMPRNSHRSKANKDAAWEFIKFMSLVGQLTFEQFVGNIPCVMKMMNDPFLVKKAQWPATRKALKYGHPKLRNFYDKDFPNDALLSPGFNAEDKILSGSAAKSTLDDAQSYVLQIMRHNGAPF